MLCLTRNPGDSIQVGPDITITIIEVAHGRVRIGLDAPPEVNIVRSELLGYAGMFFADGTEIEVADNNGDL